MTKKIEKTETKEKKDSQSIVPETEPQSNEEIKKQSIIGEFMLFIKGFGVIGLALGVVIGGATNELVQSLSKNILTPLLGLLFRVEAFNDFAPFGIGVGAFISSLMNFIILMFIIWLAVKVLIGRFLTPDEKKKIGIN